MKRSSSNAAKPHTVKDERPTPNVQRPIADPSVQEILAILHKWGIHTLGQLAALDREELRSRLGPEAVRLWQRANGTSTRLLKFVQPRESFEESFEFEYPMETAQPLLFMLRRFLEQLAVRLSAIYLLMKQLTLRIDFANPPRDRFAAASKWSYERCFKIPQPTNDLDFLFRMLHTHLENFKSKYPIIAVALTAKPIKPASQQFRLFETPLRNPHQLYETLARLIALLGTDRVGTPVLEETYRPDAFRMEPFAWRQNDEIRMSNYEGNPNNESRHCVALRRFRPPARTSIFISEHRHLESEKVRGQIIDQIGPFLFSGNWWDENAWARSEWDIHLENGELIRAHQADPPSQGYGVAGAKWAIDGIYD
jgi:protein ImuB